MRATVGEAYLSTLISFSVSTLSLLTVALVAGIPVVPTEEMLHTAPWWSWLGGVIALMTITSIIYLFKELGQLQTMVIPLFSQLIFSLAIDHFGWFGAQVIPMNANRLTGALLLVGQLALSLLMEQRGWLGAPQKKITPIQIIGILLMLCGIGCIRL